MRESNQPNQSGFWSDVSSLDGQSSTIREFSAVPELHASGSCHSQPVFVCTFTVLADVNQLKMTGAPSIKIWNSSELSYYTYTYTLLLLRSSKEQPSVVRLRRLLSRSDTYNY